MVSPAMAAAEVPMNFLRVKEFDFSSIGFDFRLVAGEKIQNP
jgi:hypothetical protein